MRRQLALLAVAAAIIAGGIWILVEVLDLSPQRAAPGEARPDPPPPRAEPAPATAAGPHRARYWQEMGDNRVLCKLCPHDCLIPEGGRGRCRVRQNREGALYSLVYGRPAALGIGPIEKAPFHHFHPGHERQTIATVGCNLRCRHCQNWHISQREFAEGRYRLRSPQEIVAGVRRAGLNSVSFTYTEPTVFFEYMYDIAQLAQEYGMKTTLVTNGFINPEPLRALLEHLDAVRVDLKAFTEEFYRQMSGGTLAPVLETLRIIQQEGVWLEIVHLVIPTLNDCPEEMRAMAAWIRENLGPDVPLHINRFFPAFTMTHLPPTPIATLEMAHRVATEVGLNFVTIGNVPGHRYESTFCPACEERTIHRVGMSVLANNVARGRCAFCAARIPGVWD